MQHYILTWNIILKDFIEIDNPFLIIIVEL